MQLTPDDIKEFKDIFRKEYGVELSDDEASAHARSLLQLFRAVTRAVTRDKGGSPIDDNISCDLDTQNDDLSSPYPEGSS